MAKSKSVEQYLRFLRLKDAVKPPEGMPRLDANDTALLTAIVLEWDLGEPLKVSGAMEKLSNLGSPSTVHRRLSKLRDFGYLANVSNPPNIRAKLLAPTQQAMTYFSQLGGAISSALG